VLVRTRILVESLGAVVVVPALFIAAGAFPFRPSTVLWLSSVGALMGASHYCLHRAKEHLTQAWHDSARYTPAILRPIRSWSLSLSDYGPEAKPWFWATWVFLALAGFDWILG
jgi:hypothetical protein